METQKLIKTMTETIFNSYEQPMPIDFFIWFFDLPKIWLFENNESREYLDYIRNGMRDYLFQNPNDYKISNDPRAPTLFSCNETRNKLTDILTKYQENSQSSDILDPYMNICSEYHHLEDGAKKELLEEILKTTSSSYHKDFVILIRYILEKLSEGELSYDISHKTDTYIWLAQLKNEILYHFKYYDNIDKSTQSLIAFKNTSTFMIDAIMNLNNISNIGQWRIWTHPSHIGQYFEGEGEFKEENLFNNLTYAEIKRSSISTLCDNSPKPKLPRPSKLSFDNYFHTNIFLTSDDSDNEAIKNVTTVLGETDDIDQINFYNHIISQRFFLRYGMADNNGTIDNAVHAVKTAALKKENIDIKLQFINEHIEALYSKAVHYACVKKNTELIKHLLFRIMPTNQVIARYFDNIKQLKFFQCLQAFNNTLRLISEDKSSISAMLHDKTKLKRVLSESYKFLSFCIHDKLLLDENDPGELSLVNKNIYLKDITKIYAFRRAAKLYENIMMEHVNLFVFVFTVMFQGTYMNNLNYFGSLLLGFGNLQPLTTGEQRQPPAGLNIPQEINYMCAEESSTHTFSHGNAFSHEE